jgi:GNAT superfamily N-acetyltransferase
MEIKRMIVIKAKELTNEQKELICQLWNHEYPKKLAHENIIRFDEYLNSLTDAEHYLLFDESEKMNGWGIKFIRDNETWFAIIIDSKVHGEGLGTLLLDELKKANKELNGWVIDHEKDVKQNGEQYKSPIEFYKKNKFLVLEDSRIENEKISAIKINWKNINSSR